MRVDPNYVVKLSSALSQSSYNEQVLTQELSSGLRVSTLSDDPVAAATSTRLSSSISNLDSFVQRATTEQGTLQVTDSTLGEVVTQLTRAITVATGAANGTLNTADRAASSNEIAGIRDQVLSLANTSYLGQHIFGGSRQNVVPFILNTSTTPATVIYNGDANAQSITTFTGQSVQVSVPGSSVFSANGADALGSLNRLVTDIASGNTSGIAEDTADVSAALANVSQTRGFLGNSLNVITSTSTYAQTQAADLTSQQNTILAANPATVATDLTSAEVQHKALLSVIASVDTTNLFSYLK